ncbi:long-chain-alcohol O-fatty-acyltransferase 11 [Carex littledalei]|uniref:Long-chain-alcohol O-fatty-acyltransferase 11 n=1 Tax=Carex littledalei TaxID=544730 RepID=A0A833QIP4_9POAL|nr:long-chain-alcohol O-fatty-acyltransferase 11 [Carex littledalei]
MFLTSGLMHELIFFYSTLRKPTGEVTVFFMLHGICVVVQGWWVKYYKWWCPPRAVATAANPGGGIDEKVLAEVSGMMVLIKDTGRWLIGSGN